MLYAGSRHGDVIQRCWVRDPLSTVFDSQNHLIHKYSRELKNCQGVCEGANHYVDIFGYY